MHPAFDVPLSGLGNTTMRRLTDLGTLPVAATLLVALNALYIALVAFGNITDYGTNEAFVRHVLAMDTTNFGAEPGTNLDDDVMWRAITNETMQDIAYIAIIAWECLSALVLIAAVVMWIDERGTSYQRARALSTTGLMMLVLLFFGGFIAIGGEWFQMWKSESWNGIEPAFRNSVLAMAALIVVHLPSVQWREPANAS
jgi:predicted small integral membrane protein